MAGDRKRLRDWSVKEFISGYGNVIPDLNVDMNQQTAYLLVLEYEYLNRDTIELDTDNDQAMIDYSNNNGYY